MQARSLLPSSRAVLDLVRSLCSRGACWASVQWIADQLQYSERQIRYALRELEDKGLIAREHRTTKRGKQRTNLLRPLPCAATPAMDCPQRSKTSRSENKRSAAAPTVECEGERMEQERLVESFRAAASAPAPARRAVPRIAHLLAHLLAKGEDLHQLARRAGAYYRAAAWTVPLATWLTSTRLVWRDYGAPPWWAEHGPSGIEWSRASVSVEYRGRGKARRRHVLVQHPDLHTCTNVERDRTTFHYGPVVEAAVVEASVVEASVVEASVVEAAVEAAVVEAAVEAAVVAPWGATGASVYRAFRALGAEWAESAAEWEHDERPIPAWSLARHIIEGRLGRPMGVEEAIVAWRDGIVPCL